jgi:hypothetical protein
VLCAARPNFIAYLAKGIADGNLIRELHFPDVPSKFLVRISRESARKSSQHSGFSAEKDARSGSKR